MLLHTGNAEASLLGVLGVPVTHSHAPGHYGRPGLQSTQCSGALQRGTVPQPRYSSSLR